VSSFQPSLDRAAETGEEQNGKKVQVGGGVAVIKRIMAVLCALPGVYLLACAALSGPNSVVLLSASLEEISLSARAGRVVSIPLQSGNVLIEIYYPETYTLSVKAAGGERASFLGAPEVDVVVRSEKGVLVEEPHLSQFLRRPLYYLRLPKIIEINQDFHLS